MPLDITPTPATSAGTATSAATGAAAPGLAALFGLLLAQTVGQPVPAAGASVKTATTATAPALLLTGGGLATLNPAGTPAVKADPTEAETTKSGSTGDKTKDKSKVGEAVPWAVLPQPTIILVPNEAPAPVTPQTARNAMDTAPQTGGESLSTSATVSAPADVIVPTEPGAVPKADALLSSKTNTVTPTEADVIVPTEADADAPTEENTSPATLGSATPQAPIVPGLVLQPAQDVMLAAAPAPTAAPTAKPTAAPTAKPTLTAAAPQTPDLSKPPPIPSVTSGLTPPVLQKQAPPADNPSGAGAGKSTGLNDKSDTTVTAMTDRVVADEGETGKPPKPGTGAEGTPAAPASPVPTLSVPMPMDAARVPAATMPTADRTQMLRQVSDGIQTVAARFNGNGQRQVTLQLHPKDWGQVNVSVTMTPTTQADGKASTQVVAHVVADQPAVKVALETHKADLRQSLKDAGLSLDKLTVTVRPAEGGAQAGLGDGRRESRGGEGRPFEPQSGASAQGGTPGGGSGSSASAAFGQESPGGRGRQQAAAYDASVTPDGAAEPEDATTLTTMTGRVDTRA